MLPLPPFPPLRAWWKLFMWLLLIESCNPRTDFWSDSITAEPWGWWNIWISTLWLWSWPKHTWTLLCSPSSLGLCSAGIGTGVSRVGLFSCSSDVRGSWKPETNMQVSNYSYSRSTLFIMHKRIQPHKNSICSHRFATKPYLRRIRWSYRDLYQYSTKFRIWFWTRLKEACCVSFSLGGVTKRLGASFFSCLCWLLGVGLFRVTFNVLGVSVSSCPHVWHANFFLLPTGVAMVRSRYNWLRK